MNLKTWCESEVGRQATLAAHLQVTPSAVSQACTGEIRIPPDWYRGIVEFTARSVDYDDLAPVRQEKLVA